MAHYAFNGRGCCGSIKRKYRYFIVIKNIERVDRLALVFLNNKRGDRLL